MKIRSNFEGSKVVVQIEVLYGFISLYAEGPFGIQKLGRYNSHIIFNWTRLQVFNVWCLVYFGSKKWELVQLKSKEGAKHMLLLFLGSAWLTCLGRPWHLVLSYFIDQQNGAKIQLNLCFSCTIWSFQRLCVHNRVCNWSRVKQSWTFIALLFISQKYGIGLL